jgi:hypothetical protein
VAYGPAQADPLQPALPANAVNPSWLAATADRERTVGVLRAGFTEGRLTQDELGERVALAYAARTYGELWALTADLPTGPLPYAGWSGTTAPVPVVAPGSPSAGTWRSATALIITALVIFTLAALVTAIITAHVQPGYPGFQQQHGPVIHVLPEINRIPPSHAPGT